MGDYRDIEEVELIKDAGLLKTRLIGGIKVDKFPVKPKDKTKYPPCRSHRSVLLHLPRLLCGVYRKGRDYEEGKLKEDKSIFCSSQ